jgi:DNA-3-methyladenine glycosylase II
MDIEAGIDLLKKDKNMQVLINKFGRPDLNPRQDYFQSLLRSIVFQQLSGKAAQTIYERFVNLIPKTSNHCPNEVLKLDKEEMRKAGLSFRKIDYVRNLADYFKNNSFQKKDVERMSDQEISKELIQIKGIGQWTVDMFLMFTLNRADILPCTDLGIQKGIMKILNMKNLPSKKEMENCSRKWRPYRTIACWYLWRMVDDKFAQ